MDIKQYEIIKDYDLKFSRIYEKVKAAGWGYEIQANEIMEEEKAAQFIDVKDYKGKGMEIS